MRSDFFKRTMGNGRKAVVSWCCFVTAAVAGAVVLGWYIQSAPLKSIVPRYISMKANTACGFLFLAIALWQFRSAGASWRRHIIGYTAIASTIAIAVGTLLEYWTGKNFGIDELLFLDPDGIKGHFPPGRLAPITATSFIICSVALLAGNVRRFSHQGVSQFLACTAFVLSFQAMLGYVLGFSYSFGLAFYTQMAIHTTFCFAALCVGILVSRLDQGLMPILTVKDAGGTMARRFIATAILVPVLVNWLERVGQTAGLFGVDAGILIRVVANVVVLVVIVWKSAQSLHETEAKRQWAEFETLRLEASRKLDAVTKESEARMRAIFNTAHDAIVGMTTDGVITDWNPQAVTMFGWEHSEAIGRPIYEMLSPPGMRSANQIGIRHFLKNPELPSVDRSVEVQAQKRNGEIIVIQLSLSPIKIKDTFIFMAFIADITQRKKVQADLIAAREAALDAARTKSEFLANMSHEIRTPLNGILGMTDLLLETSLSDDQRKFAKIVSDSGTGLLKILNDILDFSKIEAGKFDLDTIDFDLREMLESGVALLTPQARQKGLRVDAQIDPAIPSEVNGDSARIGQIFLNIFGNAIKFTQQGHIKIRVTQSVSTEIGFVVRFEIQDTGIGLSEKSKNNLFRPFAQGDGSTARKFGGTGLGLSISKRLAELMGGEIGVESEEGVGSMFWFSVCLKPTTKIASTLEPAREVRGPEKICELRSDCRLLVAEDNAVNRMLVLAQLSSLGFRAEAVTNGAEVIEAFSRGQYDLILMDCQMPIMDGFEATRAIRKLENGRSHVPIVALTASAMAEDKRRCLANGMDDYLSKPIKKERLAEIIESHLSEQKKSKAS